ncbi:MAG TPA: hypothetical protein VGR32_13360 [Brevundimonas sp.]|jgi:hypothetical protein|uniref:hypothetical protein n=1 Tax=Brevundimonas sp. TaxID=1871086 RepID=UPI002DF2DED7|nr:hypothetical protein [Brevundimonas sp.]
MSLSAVLVRLAAIEAEALSAYARHGLPTRPGHYRKGPRAKAWSLLAADLSPEARWAEVLARPPEKGWRHATLADLGAMDGRPGPRRASATLKTLARLRARLSSGEPLTPEDLLAALELTRGPSRSRA